MHEMSGPAHQVDARGPAAGSGSLDSRRQERRGEGLQRRDMLVVRIKCKGWVRRRPVCRVVPFPLELRLGLPVDVDVVRVEAPGQARGVAEEAGPREGLDEARAVAAAAEAREAGERRAPR